MKKNLLLFISILIFNASFSQDSTLVDIKK